MLRKPLIKIKPWGREIWFAKSEFYAGKILEIKKGCRYSLQYHQKKHETQFLIKGKIKMTIGGERNTLHEYIMNPGDAITIIPPTIHRAEALEDSEIFEVSTPELDDVVKIQDDYGRSGKGNDEKQDKIIAEQLKSQIGK